MIEIKRLIAHNINLNNFSDGPIVAKQCIDLSDKKIVDFFETHLYNSRHSSYVKNCSFSSRESNLVRDSVTNLSKIEVNAPEYESEFIKISINLVNHLLTCMQGRSKSDGSFIFIEYVETIDEKSINYLAILKMDSNNNFRVVISEEGIPTLEYIENALPSLNEKLHKAAFIKILNHIESNDKIHLHVLDKQRAGFETSAFFLSLFLAAKGEATPENMSSATYDALSKVAKTLISNTNERLKFLRDLKHELGTPGKFNLDEDFPGMIRSYVSSDMDLTPTVTSAKKMISLKIEEPVYTFDKSPETMSDIVYKDESESVRISVAANLEKGSDYTIAIKDGKTIFTFDETVTFDIIL